MEPAFLECVANIPDIGLQYHRETILENSKANASYIEKTINDITLLSGASKNCLIISAGPSLYREGLLVMPKLRIWPYTIVATDGAYIQCIKAGFVPDYVITIDPHPTRVVRWFGDPNFTENSANDDYFQRQDLDIQFRQDSAAENAKNIGLVDKYRTKLIISSTAPKNVVERTAGFDRYWFNPLVDNPVEKDSLTKELFEITQAPALNTGGTVGTAAWCFAHHIIRSRNVGIIGMDFGYYPDMPLEKTQSWRMFNGDKAMYPTIVNPQGRTFFTDPTYWWYRGNFLELLRSNHANVTNCDPAGLLFGENVEFKELGEWLAMHV